MSIQKYILASNEDLSNIFIPLKSTQKIKYTCFDISTNYILFGATSGGVYIFNRSPCSFYQLIPNMDGAIVQLTISPNEKLIGFATVKGTVVIIERNSSITNNRLTQSTGHQGNQITSLLWNPSNNDLYIGDDTGRVSVIQITLYLGSTMFQSPWYQLMQFDSPIVQFDYYKEFLLISTMARSYLCHTNREQYKQIGQKPRDGVFGGCFLNSGFGYRIYCARPGGRLWEVDLDGSVQNTQHYKPTLITTHSSDIHDILNREIFIPIEESNETIKNFNFTKLVTILNRFIITFNSEGLFVLDINHSTTLLWNSQMKNIQDIKVMDDTIYIQFSTTGMLYRICLFNLEQFFINLYITKNYESCIDNLDRYKENILNQIDDFQKLHIICDLKQKMPSNLILSEEIDNIFSKLKKAYERSKEERLQSSSTGGIVVVENYHKLKLNGSSSPSINWKPVIDSFADETPKNLFDQLLQITRNQKQIVNFNDYFSQKQIATMREIITKSFRTKWIVQNYFTNLVNLDKDISEFVYKLITLLDLNTILDDLVGLEMKSFYKSTWSILNGIKNIPISITTPATTTKEESSRSLPYRLKIAYCLLESNQIDSFIQYTQGINAKLIFYLFTCLMTTTPSDDKSALFLTYLDKCESVLMSVLNDSEMSDYLLDIYIKYYIQPGLSCECKFPTINTDYKDNLNYTETRRRQRLGSLLLSHRRNESKEICAQIPALWSNYLLMLRSEPVDKVLSLVVQLGNWTSFEPWIMRMSPVDWKKLLSLQKECLYRCLGCEKQYSEKKNYQITGLPWSQIGITLVRHLGPKEALQLLTQYQDIIPLDQLNAKFYQSLILVGLVESKESGLRDPLIDLILKGGQSPLFSNQIANLVVNAFQTDNDLRVSKQDEAIRHSPSTSSSSSSSMDSDMSVIGDAWGIHLDLTTINCPVCSLSFESRLALEEGRGMTLFQCGHYYHTLCFNKASSSVFKKVAKNGTNQSCPICYQIGSRV